MGVEAYNAMKAERMRNYRSKWRETPKKKKKGPVANIDASIPSWHSSNLQVGNAPFQGVGSSFLHPHSFQASK